VPALDSGGDRELLGDSAYLWVAQCLRARIEQVDPLAEACTGFDDLQRIIAYSRGMRIECGCGSCRGFHAIGVAFCMMMSSALT